jgi:hypothetical protein
MLGVSKDIYPSESKFHAAVNHPRMITTRIHGKMIKSNPAALNSQSRHKNSFSLHHTRQVTPTSLYPPFSILLLLLSHTLRMSDLKVPSRSAGACPVPSAAAVLNGSGRSVCSAIARSSPFPIVPLLKTARAAMRLSRLDGLT